LSITVWVADAASAMPSTRRFNASLDANSRCFAAARKLPWASHSLAAITLWTRLTTSSPALMASHGTWTPLAISPIVAAAAATGAPTIEIAAASWMRAQVSDTFPAMPPTVSAIVRRIWNAMPQPSPISPYSLAAFQPSRMPTPS
jgi:hypothetical protein